MNPISTTSDPTASPEVPKKHRFRASRMSELRATTDGTIDWLWHGYLARRNVSLLVSQWKAGKTTLVSVLLARMGIGGEVAGRAVRSGQAIVVSEEDEALWVDRDKLLNIGDHHVRYLCRKFAGQPTPAEWSELVDYLCDEARAGRLDLAVIDPVAAFVPGSENDAAAMLALIKPLQRLASLGVAVLMLHHPRKGSAAAGQAARGSGALSAAADIMIEMGWLGLPADDDRRRLLRAYSRHRATPRRLAIEWTANGLDYMALGESAVDDFDACWPVLQSVLEDAHQKLTRRGILKNWPQDHPAPSEATLRRWLDRALADGRVLRDGLGRNRAPYRFWLKSQEEVWKLDPLHLEDLPEFDDFDLARASGNILRRSAEIDEERRQKRERKRKKKDAKPQPEEFEDDVEDDDDDRPCRAFGEEARWLAEESRRREDAERRARGE